MDQTYRPTGFTNRSNPLEPHALSRPTLPVHCPPPPLRLQRRTQTAATSRGGARGPPPEQTNRACEFTAMKAKNTSGQIYTGTFIFDGKFLNKITHFARARAARARSARAARNRKNKKANARANFACTRLATQQQFIAFPIPKNTNKIGGRIARSDAPRSTNLYELASCLARCLARRLGLSIPPRLGSASPWAHMGPSWAPDGARIDPYVGSDVEPITGPVMGAVNGV